MVGVNFIFEFGAAGIGDFAKWLAAGFNAIGQAAGQIRERVDLGVALAQDITHGAVAVVLLADVLFQSGLVAAQFGLQGIGVEAAHPAFGFVDFGTLLGGVEQGLSVKRDSTLQIHALTVGVLFVAAVHRNPGIGRMLAGTVGGTSARVVADVGFYPDVLHAKGVVLAAFGENHVGYPALAEQLLGSFTSINTADLLGYSKKNIRQ